MGRTRVQLRARSGDETDVCDCVALSAVSSDHDGGGHDVDCVRRQRSVLRSQAKVCWRVHAEYAPARTWVQSCWVQNRTLGSLVLALVCGWDFALMLGPETCDSVRHKSESKSIDTIGSYQNGKHLS